MTEDKMQILKAKLEKIAARETWEDSLDADGDTIVDDFAGGNIDDAYSGGYDSGRGELARELLAEFFEAAQ